jgi:hypothetical protein
MEMTVNQEYVGDGQNHSQNRARQRLRQMWWAAVLVWAGVVLGADNMGLLPRFGDVGAWSWIFLGAGILGILGAVYRVTTPSAPKPATWDWVWSAFCLIIGMGGFTTRENSWPLALVLIGGAILVDAVWERHNEVE